MPHSLLRFESLFRNKFYLFLNLLIPLIGVDDVNGPGSGAERTPHGGRPREAPEYYIRGED